MNSMFHGIFGKVAPGLCRLSINGSIAVKTSNGYKSYNIKTGQLTNCDSFAFDIGEEFFFVIPTSKAEAGDIILAAGKPKCVIKTEKNLLTVINYENSVIEYLLPEHHMFMGNTYFYGKIVSIFGSSLTKGKKGINKMMQYMMISEMMKGSHDKTESGISAVLPLMMMGGSMETIFDGIFDLDEEETGEAGESEDK